MSAIVTEPTLLARALSPSPQIVSPYDGSLVLAALLQQIYNNTLPSSGGLAENVTVVAPLGSKASAAAVSVVIASDQVAVATKTASGADVDLASILAKTPALGAALTAASTPVNIASDQVVPTKAAAGAIVDLATLLTHVPAQGAAVTAASLPVNIASDQVVPVKAAAAAFADGAIVTLGTEADAAVTNPATAATIVAILKGVNTLLAASTPAGTNLIGKVGIDQTTPGTTNGVQVNAALPVGANVIGKVSIDQTTPGTTNLVQTVFGTATGTLSVTTSGTGGTYTLYGSQACNSLTVVNTTGTPVPILVQLNATGTGITIPANGFYTFTSLTNANQVGVALVTTGGAQTVIAVYN